MWLHALCAHVLVECVCVCVCVWTGSARSKQWLKGTVIGMSDRPGLFQSLGTTSSRIATNTRIHTILCTYIVSSMYLLIRSPI